MIKALRSGIAKLAAIGAVKRHGVGGLQAYGGSIEGTGKVTRKSDDPEGRWKAGDVEHFVMEGQPGQRTGA